VFPNPGPSDSRQKIAGVTLKKTSRGLITARGRFGCSAEAGASAWNGQNPLDALRASVPLVRGTIIDSAPLTRGATGGCLEV
jgi:hypothetical protein